MAMRPDQAKALIMHLGRLEKTKCPVCGNDDHTQQEAGNILLPPVISPNGHLTHGTTHEGALAELSCRKCGFTMLFDCKLVGIPV